MSVENEIPMKRCTKCGEEKVLDEFYARKEMPDGRRNECKDCLKAKSKVVANTRYAEDAEFRDRKLANGRARWRTDDAFRRQKIEASVVRQKQRYDEDPEYRARRLEGQKEWLDRDGNREAILEARRTKYASDEDFRETIIAYDKHKRATDPEYRERKLNYLRAWQSRRRDDEEFEAFMERVLREEDDMEEKQEIIV